LRNGGSPNRSLDWRSYDQPDPNAPVFPRFDIDPTVPLETMVALDGGSESESDGAQHRNTAVIIGDELLHADPDTQDEMRRKKERIYLQSLRRMEEAKENKLRKEEEARRRKEEETFKEDEKQRKKEEEKARRDAILEQHRIKKDQERLEDQGRRMPEPVSARPVPKLRNSSTASMGGRPLKPRPKTIHVDQGQDVRTALAPTGPMSRGQRGSNTNLTGRSSLARTSHLEAQHICFRCALPGLPPRSERPPDQTPGEVPMHSCTRITPVRDCTCPLVFVSFVLKRPCGCAPYVRMSVFSLVMSHVANLPPSGLPSNRTMDWAKQTSSLPKRKQSQVSVEGNMASEIKANTDWANTAHPQDEVIHLIVRTCRRFKVYRVTDVLSNF
jgi:hypothetical protein